MPEGDTIFRAASSLQKWIGGRSVSKASAKRVNLTKLIGSNIVEIEPQAKHLLMRFDNGLTLHTHMRMTGSWHVYATTGDKWKKPAYQASVILECGDHTAVCFNAPVIELMRTDNEIRHKTLQNLGPDVLNDDPFDFAAVRARARRLAIPKTTLGELLLDQRIVSGIGNIYRCESLFLERYSPWTLSSAIIDDDLDQLVATAIKLMKRNINTSSPGRDLGTGVPNQAWVYGRPNRPCRICGDLVKKGRIGIHARDVFWCPTCQANTPESP